MQRGCRRRSPDLSLESRQNRDLSKRSRKSYCRLKNDGHKLSARGRLSKPETSVRRFVINLIIRIGGLREARDGAHGEDEQGFVQAIERATRDTPAIVHKALYFSSPSITGEIARPLCKRSALISLCPLSVVHCSRTTDKQTILGKIRAAE